MALTQGAMEAIALGRGGSYSLSRDVIKHALYDTALVGTTATDVTYFTTQIGTAYGAGTKTINETNMLDSGKLPNGQTFLIQRIAIDFISSLAVATTDEVDVVQAYYNLLQSSIVEIRIAGREFDFQMPGSGFLPPVAISGALGTDSPVRVGDVIASGIIPLGVTPIFIDQLVTFSVVLRSGSGLPAIQTILDANATLLNGDSSSIRVTLEGVLTRAK